MAILSGLAVLHCQRIEATQDFYQQFLQFVVVKKRELNGELNWVHLMHADTTLMLQAVEQQLAEQLQSQSSTIALYFYVNNINELHHFIKAKNYIVSDIKITDYQIQEFSLLDPEGNHVTLGQVLEKHPV